MNKCNKQIYESLSSKHKK